MLFGHQEKQTCHARNLGSTLPGPCPPGCFFEIDSSNKTSKVPEGHHPRGTTLREALRGNLPLSLSGNLFEGSAGSPDLRGALRGSAGFFEGSGPILVTLENCLEKLRIRPPTPPTDFAQIFLFWGRGGLFGRGGGVSQILRTRILWTSGFSDLFPTLVRVPWQRHLTTRVLMS